MKEFDSANAQNVLVRLQEGKYLLSPNIRRFRRTKLSNYSDTLNRHILVHNNEAQRSKRIAIACQTCRTRKTKCDAGEPCLACCNLGVPCFREASSSQDKSQNMTRINLFNSIYEGPMMMMAQDDKCAISDKSNLMPIEYPLERNTVADIALPGDADEGSIFGAGSLHRVCNLQADHFHRIYPTG